MEQTFEDAALKVAMWWSEKAFRTRLNQDHGDRTEHGAITDF